MSLRVVFALGLVAVAALGAGAGAATDPAAAVATARAQAIRIVVPGTTGGGTALVAAPPSATPVATTGFSYPDTVAVVTAVSTNAAATAENDAKASATSGVTGLVLFGGEITADSVLARASASADGSSADGDFDGTTVQNLLVFGGPPTGSTIPLADWGTLTLNKLDVERSDAQGVASYDGSLATLEILLTADHGGLPTGTLIQIGYAETAAQATPASPEPETLPEPRPATAPQATQTETETETETTTPGPPPTTTEEVAPEVPRAPESELPAGLLPIPGELLPPLEGGPYVFPVFGSAPYGDTYGDVRSDVSYHHGADIFGELGRPLVAVANGTVFAVGRNKLGGNRLWLRDRQGNAFYYAHLSAFSTLIFDGAHVKVGQVVGFMGSTGDADGGDPHLHFEVHPVSLLYLGYDGAVDPNPYLDEWRHLLRLPYPVPPGWAPSVTGSNSAPQPGAILLSVSDISTADGLDPDSLRRAIEAPQPRP